MGSWANSFHVRADNATTVADAVRAILLGSGHRLHTGQASPPVAVGRTLPFPPRPRHDDFDDDDDQFEEDFADDSDRSSNTRGGVRSICVYQPCRGWVGVLDSEDFSDLGQQLSARLATDALSLAVNDSDAWCYALYRNGQQFDEFDSSGEDPDDVGGMTPEMQAAMESGDEDAIERLMLAHAPQGPIRMPFGGLVPPVELTMLQQRIARGQATLGDRLRCFWLGLKYRFHLLALFMGWRSMDFDFGFDIPRATPLDRATLDLHVARLREFFPDAGSRALQALLPRSSFPAEGLLADFLGILGLPRLYAYLSHRYLEDHSDDELAAEGIIRATELHFQTPS
jgi:hypothetical protein